MAKQSIKLKVAGKGYALEIEDNKEEVYRLAEREVNNCLTKIKQKPYPNWSDVDYLALIALSFAIDKVQTRMRGEVQSDELKRLKELEQTVDGYLNSLE